MNLAGGLALQAIFLHCNQKGKSVVRRISSGNLCLLVLWAVSELEMKRTEKQARKETYFTNGKPFHYFPDLGL